MPKKGPRFSTYVFGFMAVLMLVSSILPSFQNQQPTTDPIPTPTQAVPTFPAPVDTTAIAFEQTVLAPSAMFTIAQPSGWTVSPSNNVGIEVGVPDAAGIQMENTAALSQIQAYVEAPVIPVENLQQLSDRLGQSLLESTFRRFGTATQIGRRIENDKVLVDFELTSQGQQEFIARQTSWIGENNWIYTVRVVAPSNARDMLFYLVENLPATIKPVNAFGDAPVSYTAYYDYVNQHIIRYPRGWQAVEANAGSPATFQGPSNQFLNVTFEAGNSVADQAAAEAYVTGLRSGATIKSTKPVEKDGASGFSVSYGLKTLDGEPVSGLAVLLNGEDGLHVAYVRVPNVDQDYNVTPEGQVAPDVVQMLNTFTLTTSLNLPMPAVAATPIVTPVATVEATPEAVETESATPEAVATEEATPEATESGS